MICLKALSWDESSPKALYSVASRSVDGKAKSDQKYFAASEQATLHITRSVFCNGSFELIKFLTQRSKQLAHDISALLSFLCFAFAL